MSSLGDKAEHLVADGKVTITRTGRDGQPLQARVGGYAVRRSGTRYVCDCPAGWYRQICSDAVAVELASQEG